MTNLIYDLYYKFIKKNVKRSWEKYILKFLRLIFILIRPIDYKFRLLINNRNVNEDVIVSLTSIKSRINRLHVVIESLLLQTVNPKKIILWLSTDDFPLKDREIPNKLLKYKKNILEINFIEENLGPHKKYFYTLQSYPNSVVITVDDDIAYPPKIIETLLEKHESRKKAIICNISSEFSLNKRYGSFKRNKTEFCSIDIIPIGVGGVLYPPNIFSKNLFDKKVFMNLCPYGDDLWLKYNSMINNIVCCQTKYDYPMFTVLGTQRIALFKKNLGENRNDLYLKNLNNYFKNNFDQ